MNLSRGTATLLAAVAAALAFPAAAIGFDLPLWLAAVLSTGVAGGSYLVLHAGRKPGALDDGALADALNQTGRGLLADASAALDRLKRIHAQVRDPQMRGQIADLFTTGQKVVADVRADPSKAMAVRRLLTFYLPNAASLAEGWVALEGRAIPSPERMTQTAGTLRALTEAFHRFSDDLALPQMQTLDIDLKVVNDALKADLADAAPLPSPQIASGATPSLASPKGG
jgi:5-bromo-4-chloroindolyl phosphate hydrolysis protein